METLFIKNMVCNRCIMVVEDELGKMGHDVKSVKLGEADLHNQLNADQRNQIRERFKSLGFELIDESKTHIIEKIKIAIIEWVHYDEDGSKDKLSDYLIRKISLEYNYLSNLFSESEGQTLEKFAIAQKVEKIKELLSYNELSLKEIAYKMNYSSVAYLSNQFKKVTGVSPSEYRKMSFENRISLDQV